jgi:hypothetical protein
MILPFLSNIEMKMRRRDAMNARRESTKIESTMADQRASCAAELNFATAECFANDVPQRLATRGH